MSELSGGVAAVVDADCGVVGFSFFFSPGVVVFVCFVLLFCIVHYIELHRHSLDLD